MDNFYARAVFFITDVDQSKRFYIDRLGCSLDWDSNDGVFQVGLYGFELILNDTGEMTRPRAGHGRVFVGLEDDQAAALRAHLGARRVRGTRVEWGRSTLCIKDPDGNELFFWLPEDAFTDLVD